MPQRMGVWPFKKVIDRVPQQRRCQTLRLRTCDDKNWDRRRWFHGHDPLSCRADITRRQGGRLVQSRRQEAGGGLALDSRELWATRGNDGSVRSEEILRPG